MSGTERTEPIVDVGIPAWGRPSYLVRAIESVLAQSLDSWSLRISADGPSEGQTEAALVPYLDDPRITYSATSERVGAAGNKTILIRKGIAPYVALLDHDDFWGPDFLARRVRMLEAHPDAGFVFSPAVFVDDHGNEFGRASPFTSEGCQPSEAFVPLLLRSGGLPGATVVARRKAYETVGPVFNMDLPRTYDYEMWVRLALRFPVCHLAVWDVFWRRHPDQASADLSQLEAEYARLIDVLRMLVERERPELQLEDREWRAQLSSLLISAALTALEQGQQATSSLYLRRALSISPARMADPRSVAALVGLALGPPGRRLIGRLRSFVQQRRSRIVRKDAQPSSGVRRRWTRPPLRRRRRRSGDA
jgi:Glycosyl transferase family 2